MIEQVDFCHYTGCGNDFIIIDNRALSFSAADVPSLYQACSSQLSHNPDGFIFIDPSDVATARMSYFNCDGSSAAMCGNGLRCVMRFLLDTACVSSHATLESSGRCYHMLSTGEAISTRMRLAHIIKQCHIEHEGKNWSFFLVDAAVPHFVTIVDTIAALDLAHLGPFFRSHPDAGADGANVNFIQLLDKQHVAIRTYERGVERETMACGTGAVASAFVLHHIYHMPSSLSLQTASGNLLQVDIFSDHILLTGSAQKLYQGTVSCSTRQ